MQELPHAAEGAPHRAERALYTADGKASAAEEVLQITEEVLQIADDKAYAVTRHFTRAAPLAETVRALARERADRECGLT